MVAPVGNHLRDAWFYSRQAIANSKSKRRPKKRKKPRPKKPQGDGNIHPTGPSPSPPRRPTGGKVPRIRRSVTAIPIGNQAAGSSSKLYNLEFQGLFMSEPHYRFPSGKWSGGGPFYQYDASQLHTSGGYYTTIVNGSTWTGPLIGVVGVPITDWPSVYPPNTPTWDTVRAQADSYYATGRARTRPGNPVASVGQFVLELRDLPSVPFKRSMKGMSGAVRRSNGSLKNVPKVLMNELSDFSNLGSEYLNVVFGWKPFVRDLQGMYNLWKSLDKQLAQIVRNNGRSQRRRAKLKQESDVISDQKSFPVFGANLYSAPGNVGASPFGTQWRSSTRTTEEVWYAGSYRYYIPDVGSSQWTRRAKLALFGALPTPELIWEVMPWSWLIDWFSNVGDVISNASPNAVDNLVSDYAYVMRKVTYEKTCSVYTWMKGVQSGNPATIGRLVPSISASATSTYKWTIQSRSGSGNPFGLGLQLSALTGHQLAILAALGISRSKVN